MGSHRRDTFDKPIKMKFLLPLLAVLLGLFPAAAPGINLRTRSPAKTRKLFIITIDGFRWQEVFTGADPLLVTIRICQGYGIDKTVVLGFFGRKPRRR
jgi:hypothetical protein